MSNPNYVVVKFFWKDDFEDTHEVPRTLPMEYSRRRETRGGKREDVVPGYTAVRFRKRLTVTLTETLYEEV